MRRVEDIENDCGWIDAIKFFASQEYSTAWETDMIRVSIC